MAPGVVEVVAGVVLVVASVVVVVVSICSGRTVIVADWTGDAAAVMPPESLAPSLIVNSNVSSPLNPPGGA